MGENDRPDPPASDTPGAAGASSGMNRPRPLSAAGRCRRIGPAGAAVLLVLLASACVEPGAAPPSTESQPPPAFELG